MNAVSVGATPPPLSLSLSKATNQDAPMASEHVESAVVMETVKSAALESTRPVPGSSSRASATVAPLPAIDAFHVGHVLRDPSQQPPAPTHEQEESYIPVALAKAHLARVVQDMHAMKEEQTAKMAEILARYRAIEAETKAFYETKIGTLKSKASAKFLQEQQRYKELEDSSRGREQALREDIGSLERTQEQERQRHSDDRERWREDLEATLLWQEEELARLQARVEREIERVRREHRDQLSDARRSLENELRMACEDVSSATLRLASHLQELREEADAHEQRYRRECQALEARLTVERDVALCLGDVVSRVVEHEQLTTHRQRSLALQTEIARLSEEVRTSRARESALDEQLSRVKAAHTRRERSAVSETLELMVRTVEMRPPSPPPPQVRPPTPAKPEMRDQQTLAALRVKSRDVDTQAKSETSDASTATDVLVDEIETAEKKKEQVENADSSSSLSSVSSDQLQFEADVERFRERNAELVRSKQTLREAKLEMQRVLDEKNAAKAQIKAWLAAFQAEHGPRDPTIEEKLVAEGDVPGVQGLRGAVTT
ncbi:hypothetical protein PINS_up022073 [Pythium insidiosum]|nr:hypothetical protein PINS_up022073 [Pythium insidiosum]